MSSPEQQRHPPTRTWRGWPIVGIAAAIVSALTVGEQIHDTNFYTLWEASAILAGDHPYRDFFEWGAPLQVAVSALGQALSGRRLLGEIALQWAFILAGLALTYRIALRLSGSVAASVAMMLLAVAVLAVTPGFHYPKLFVYPLAIVLTWRYMDRPGAGRGAAVGAATAAAFLFRHDHGVYVGVMAVAAFVVLRLAEPSSRNVRQAMREAGAYTAVLVALLVPWLVLVQSSEGLVEYVRGRAELYADWSSKQSTFERLRTMDPVAMLAEPSADAETAARDARGPLAWLPATDRSQMWLLQVSVLLPFLVLGGTLLDLTRAVRRSRPWPPDAAPVLVFAAFLIGVEDRLFHVQGYLVVVAPLTAACAARLVARRWQGGLAGRVLAAAAVATTAAAVASFARTGGLSSPLDRLEELPDQFVRLTASPAIDGFAPLENVRRFDPEAWPRADNNDRLRVRLRYVYECTEPGDRVLLTGTTPYDVPYYVERRIAGGHLYWHHGWRKRPAQQEEGLALLEREPVPVVLSTSDPILDDFAGYPRIRGYLLQHYVDLDKTDGRMLVDGRREAKRRFEPFGWPCFTATDTSARR